jgi:DNA-directed RNA polymerase specialized sigma24 family protein
MPLLQRPRPPTATSRNPAPIPAAAFAQLYGAYFDPIYWYCRSRLGDAMPAEDATASVVTHALAAGPRNDDPALRSWLFGIGHNVLANRFRAARPVAPLDAVLEILDTRPLPEDIVVADEERDRLLGALRRVPATVSHAHLVAVPGADHSPHCEQPERFLAVAAAFLDEVEKT